MLPAFALLLSAVLFGSPIAAASEDRGTEEREAATTIAPVTEAPARPNAVPLAVIVPVTQAPATPVVPGQETTAATTTAQTAAVIEPSGGSGNNNNSPSDNSWFGGWFQDIIDAIEGIGDFFTSSENKGIGKLFKDLTSTIAGLFDSMWDKLVGSITTAIYPLGDKNGMVEILKDGGTAYVSDSLNRSIDIIYDVFAPFGVIIMLLSFCFAIARGCFTTDLSAKNSILQPVLGMIVALAAFALAEEIMTALFTVAMNLTATVVEKAFTQDIQIRVIKKILGGGTDFDKLGYAVLNCILQLILMVNVAKIALMQSIAPLFIGFASGQGTRRFTLNLVKEYAKCCLVPPVTAAYAILTFSISESTWGVFASIVIGFSIFSMASKQLDKLLN